jgi:hypothetical protein
LRRAEALTRYLIVYRQQQHTLTLYVQGERDLVNALMQAQNIDPSPMAWVADPRSVATSQKPNP